MLRTQLPSPAPQATRPKNPTRQMEPNIIDRVGLNLSTGNYLELIQKLSNMFQQSQRDLHNHSKLSNDEPRDWIDVVLSTGYRSVTLRIRHDNLYLDGYQMSNGQWLEFNRDDGKTTHLIPGSNFLGYTGSYTDLERVGQRPITGMQVNRNQVLSAVNELAVVHEGWLRARHLALLILVICEATRSENMSHRFANVMSRGSTGSVVVEEWMVESIRARGKGPTWQVNWEAKVVGRGGYDHLRISGYLKAKFCVRGVERELVLFERTWNNRAKVFVGESLPLSTIVTEVPVGVPLDVDVSIVADKSNGLIGGNRRLHIELGEGSGQFTIMDNDLVKITAKWSRLSK